MHFITGGAYNGKRAWVNKYYRLEDRDDFCWISAYDQKELPVDFTSIMSELVILEGVELWIRKLVEKCENSLSCRQQWQSILHGWHQYEQDDANRTVVVIGSDITKGIVPIDKLERKWRDVTGYAFQDIARLANRTDVVWYGISTRLK